MISSRSASVPLLLDGERFDVVAVHLFPDLSRKKIKSIIDAGGAYVNKRRVAVAKRPMRHGEKVEIFWDTNTPPDGKGGGVATRILTLTRQAVLFSGEGYLVINKPAGIASQATLTSSTDTILHALANSFPQEFPLESLHLVHRLDKDTSGVMILARTAEWQKRLEEVFREARAQKVYEALCLGVPKPPSGSIHFPVAPDRSRKNAWMPVFGSRKIQGMKSAETEYSVVESFPCMESSLVECRPRTGRTHQIRVHLGAIGCPLLGDRTYSNNVVGHPCGQLAVRHMLHARRLRIDISGGLGGEWEAPLPEDFLSCLGSLRRLESGER